MRGWERRGGICAAQVKERTMKTTTFLGTIAAVTLSTSALAQGGPPPDPYGDATVGRAEVEAQAAVRFDQLDTNHDGSLTVEERRAGFAGRGGPGGGRGPGGAAAGPQDKAAFVAAQVARFEQQDANHDGKLTKAERDEFRAQMMQRMMGGGFGGQ
jgi:hypothetical protein